MCGVSVQVRAQSGVGVRILIEVWDRKCEKRNQTYNGAEMGTNIRFIQLLLAGTVNLMFYIKYSQPNIHSSLCSHNCLE